MRLSDTGPGEREFIRCRRCTFLSLKGRWTPSGARRTEGVRFPAWHELSAVAQAPPSPQPFRLRYSPLEGGECGGDIK